MRVRAQGVVESFKPLLRYLVLFATEVLVKASSACSRYSDTAYSRIAGEGGRSPKLGPESSKKERLPLAELLESQESSCIRCMLSRP